MLTMDSSIDNAIIAFEEGIKCGARDADGIWKTYLRLTSEMLEKALAENRNYCILLGALDFIKCLDKEEALELAYDMANYYKKYKYV